MTDRARHEEPPQADVPERVSWTRAGWNRKLRDLERWFLVFGVGCGLVALVLGALGKTDDPQRLIRQGMGIIAVAGPVGVALHLMRRRLVGPMGCHAVVLRVTDPPNDPFFVVSCDCGDFGDVASDRESAFSAARAHTSNVGETVVDRP